MTTSMWEAAVTRHIGVSGIEFTPTRVGQTLHLPCSRGHLVDFTFQGAKPPEFIAKKLLQQGWTIGHKLLCPEHSRKSGQAKCGTEAPPMPVQLVAPPIKKRLHTGGKKPWAQMKIAEALEQFGSLRVGQIADLTQLTPASTDQALRRMIGKGEVVRNGPQGASLYSLITKEPPMPEATVTPIQPVPATAEISDAARTARRLATLLLEEKFDVATGQYRDGYTDEKVAKETGAALAFVFKRREDDFGPLKVPGDLQDCRDEIARIRLSAQQQLEAIEVENRQKIGLIVRDLDNCVNRIETLVRRNGWES